MKKYAIRINEIGFPEHLYFGVKCDVNLLSKTEFPIVNRTMYAYAPGKDIGYHNRPAEISFFGTGDYREPSVMIENYSGGRLFELLYTGYDILPVKPGINGMPSLSGGETLVIHLKDSLVGFAADLFYTIYDDCNVITRQVEYKNLSNKDISLKRAYSFYLTMPGLDYNVLSLYGYWSNERNCQYTPIMNGCLTVDSKRGMSSAALNPFIAICDKNVTEESGNVLGISLVYSGSFAFRVEGVVDSFTHISGGINDFDFDYLLKSGEVFETPEAVLSYSSEGLGGMSRSFHDAFRNHLISKDFVFKKRPVVINNWEATRFDFTEQQIYSFVETASKTEIDTFVLDDGWFGKRNDTESGLGDWDIINTPKLPNGLKALSDFVHSKNMNFGLWFEPEMINEDSELFRKHPDFVIKSPDRIPCKTRGQYVLDLTNIKVRDYIVNVVNRVIDENGVDYVKWDCNRNLTEFTSLSFDGKSIGEFAHRYCLGLYDILERIVFSHPNVFFEGCSSGGARFDAGMLCYFPQIWTSDNTDADDRSRIQYGTSLCYPLSSMSCHVSMPKERNIDLNSRFTVASMGAFGYEFDPNKLSSDELSAIIGQINEYQNKISELVLKGDLYRIDCPQSTEFYTQIVVSKDKSKAFLISFKRDSDETERRIKLIGLDENAIYGFGDEKLSGSALMKEGIIISYQKQSYKSARIYFERV